MRCNIPVDRLGVTYHVTYVIKSFTSKGLKELFQTGKSRRIGANFHRRALLILDYLHAATSPEAMNIPGMDFHRLRGDRSGAYAVKLTGNWRITFEWDDGAINVDMEDYH